MGLFDQPHDLQLLRGGVSHASSSPSAVTLFLSRRFSRVRSATTSLSAVASRRRSLTSSEVAARSNEPFARLVASWVAIFEKDLDRAKSEADVALSLNRSLWHYPVAF